jgi:FKBP-type peptidyl-prolyl cis-trans isomerase SlyD
VHRQQLSADAVVLFLFGALPLSGIYSMIIADNTVALLAYTLTNPDGEVLDKSTRDEPFAYLHGTGGIIPGLERKLEGKAPDDRFTITIEPVDAYGDRDESLVSTVGKDLFDDSVELEPGMTFIGESDQGSHSVVVTEVVDDTVTIDANPPLAGVQLTFEVQVLEVREASPEEIEHGHVHGAGGHQH